MRSVLIGRVRFLTLAAAAFVTVGTLAEWLEIAEPYTTMTTVR
jgi:hypothetical protein